MGAVGPRGGAKTKDMSIVKFLKANHRQGYQMAHVGGTTRQADLCYGYVRQYHSLHPWFEGNVDGVPLMSRTRWRNGSDLFILPPLSPEPWAVLQTMPAGQRRIYEELMLDG